MKDDLIKYFEDCTNTLPVNGIIGQSVVLCLLAVVVLIIFGKRKGWKWSAAFLPVEYLVWIVFLVLIFRTTMPERTAILTPFWSHDPSLEGYGHLHPQVIMNVLVFIPVGVLLGCAFDKMKWWKGVLREWSILICLISSLFNR